MYKVDLHTHSILSPDGGLSERDYQRILDEKLLDYIAITDHNEITFAQRVHKKFGDSIIVGEEIQTRDGEMIGLFLTTRIMPGLPAKETAKLIHHQHGIVLIPHPFEKMRKGISEPILRGIYRDVDMIEVFNGRSLLPKTRRSALIIASQFGIVPVASSDAHCLMGIGKSYSSLSEKVDRKTVRTALQKSIRTEGSAPWLSYLCPKINRIRSLILKR